LAMLDLFEGLNKTIEEFPKINAISRFV